MHDSNKMAADDGFIDESPAMIVPVWIELPKLPAEFLKE
jgi:hypothetical protein